MSSIRIGCASLLLAAAMGALPGHAIAQNPSGAAPLEEFVQEIARLWLAADVVALVELIPEEDQFLLDTGRGTEPTNPRHAAAALRALFADYRTSGARAVAATVSESSPAAGFGELRWTFRERGAPGEQSRVVYVAVREREGAWEITELRLMP